MGVPQARRRRTSRFGFKNYVIDLLSPAQARDPRKTLTWKQCRDHSGGYHRMVITMQPDKLFLCGHIKTAPDVPDTPAVERIISSEVRPPFTYHTLLILFSILQNLELVSESQTTTR